MIEFGSYNLSGSAGHASNTTGSQTINKPTISPGSTGYASSTMGATGHTSNTPGSTGYASNATDTTGHASNTTGSQTINKPTINPDAIGHISDTTGPTSHADNTPGSSGQINNKPTINPGSTGHITNPNATPKKEAITDLYMQDGDDYYIDDNALSNAQMKTGDNETAASAVENNSGDSSKTNSNINTGVFGGSSKAAHPGYSLW